MSNGINSVNIFGGMNKSSSASSNPIKKQEFTNSTFNGKGPTNLDYSYNNKDDSQKSGRSLYLDRFC